VFQSFARAFETPSISDTPSASLDPISCINTLQDGSPVCEIFVFNVSLEIKEDDGKVRSIQCKDRKNCFQMEKF